MSRLNTYGALIASAIVILTGCKAGSIARVTAGGDEPPRMYPGFGGYSRDVTTTSPEAQRWFNQGIQLLYGYNHDEAIRSFTEAARLDPDCAMAWWGIAYASGLHINNTEMSEQQSRQAYQAAQDSLKVLNDESPVEKALVRAVAERYAWPIPADRSHLDIAYADAMERAWRSFGTDADVGTLYAESLMDLQPWDLWTPEGDPKGRTLEIVATLERAIELMPDHPGANHFYIHTVEASSEPERAIPSADRLVDLVPGAGHLVHMPSHIYARVGRYAEAADANERAIAADRAYFAEAPEPMFYSLYFVHNIHFLAYAAMMEGRYSVAMDAARSLEEEVPEAFLHEYVSMADGMMPTTFHVMIRFGKWNDILNEPEAPEFRIFSRAIRRYARGVALAALGRPAEARVELAEFESLAAAIPDDWAVGNNSLHDVLAIARRMLNGEILFREGALDEAFALLREGAALEDQLRYDEPPGWMQPVRHALGALLMASGRPEDAAAVYAEDLAHNPENGWSLLGIEMALRESGHCCDAESYAARRQLAWRRAEINPTSSCFCEP